MRSRSGSGSRFFLPALVGILVAGMSFVGIALASQLRAPGSSTEPSDAVIEAAQLWLDAATPNDDPSPVATKSLDASKPVSLDIGAIDVHSGLNEVGLDTDGTIETPSGELYDEAAWYRYSPAPGSLGPAVLLGHVDSAANGPSVFFRLGELTRGDSILVTRADGSVARFIVDRVSSFAKVDFPTQEVYGDLDYAGLRLITCGGPFDEVAGHYLNNIVVFARLDPSAS